MARTRYVVTYDVVSDQRRARVFKALRDNGDHIQYSVFLCELNERELIALKEVLTRELSQREDQVLFVDLGPADAEISKSLDWLGRALQAPTRVLVV